MVEAVLHIRRAREGDVAAMADVHRAAIRTMTSHYADAHVAAWAASIAPAGYMDDLRSRDVLVAAEDRRIVGFGVLDVEVGLVRALYVEPGAGRRGVGRRVLTALETIARLRGVAGLRLESSLNAVAWYAAAAWRRGADITRGFPGGRDIPCVEMTKRLPPLRLEIDAERPADVAAARAVTQEAFVRHVEADIVDHLRAEGALVVSLVARIDGIVVGHVAFSRVQVRGVNGVLGLGPIAVSPACHRCGVGSRLVEEGLARAREHGAPAVVVLGESGYYTRFGFTTASRFGIRSPSAVPESAFMAAELRPGVLAGAEGPVRYHAAFDMAAGI
jgi:putative acetyltransferase